MSPEDPADGARRDRSAFERIDDAIVPRLQQAAGGVRRGLGWPSRVLHRFDRWFLGGRPARTVDDHRGLVAFVVVLLAFTGTLVHFQRFPELRDPAPTGVGDSATDVAAVGPVVGASVDRYLSERRDALASAPADARRVAVVSFAEFRTVTEAAEQLGGLTVHEVLYRMPRGEVAPERVPVRGDLVEAVESLVAERIAEIQQEEADVASTLETTDDQEFQADFRARLDELAALRNTLQTDPAIVYAVVVEGRVEALRGLAGSPDVRLVDLAPAGTEIDTTAFHGLLPTATDRFRRGRTVG